MASITTVEMFTIPLKIIIFMIHSVCVFLVFFSCKLLQIILQVFLLSFSKFLIILASFK